jgi:threonine dehydrogenase-like Zn-dependent dehydrogenase
MTLGGALRVSAHWLVLQVAGLLLLIMVLGAAGDMHVDKGSRITFRTKAIAAAAGAALAVALLGSYLLGQPLTSEGTMLARVLVFGLGPVGLALSAWSWLRIARDLGLTSARGPGRLQ